MRKIKYLGLIIIIISIVFFISRTSSRYILEENLSGDIYLEIPYLAINATIPTQEMKPYSYTTLEFSLDNYVGDDISEVPINYYITLNNETKLSNEAQEIQRNYTNYSYQIFDITDDPTNPVELNYVSNKGYETSIGYGTKQTKDFLVKLITNYSYYELLNNNTDVYRIYVDSEDYNGESGYKLRRTVDFNGHTTSTYNELTATVTPTSNTNEFNIQLTNTNSYKSRFKISESTNKFDMTYTDYDSLTYDNNGFIDIPAGATANIKVKFTKKSNEDYTNYILTESDGSEYVPVGINIEIYEWVGMPVRTIAQNQKVYLKSRNLIMDALNIGSFVAYSPSATQTPYTVLATYSGLDTDQTITADTDLNWRILNINRADDTVDLISGLSTTDSLTLKGAQGYNNGVELLNDICSKQYGNTSIGATARSINVQDLVDKLVSTTTLTDSSLKGSSNETLNEFGEDETVTGNIFYPSRWDNYDRLYSGTKLGIPTYFSTSGSLIEGDAQEPASNNTNGTLTVKSTYTKFTKAVLETNQAMQLLPENAFKVSSGPTYFQILLRGQLYTLNSSWFATRIVSPKRGINQVDFGIFVWKSDTGVSNTLYKYDGSENTETHPIRPIVTLPVEYINIDEKVTVQYDPGNGTTSKSAWKVENTSLFNAVNNPSSGE